MIILSLISLNQTYLKSTADSFQNSLNKNAQKIVNTKRIDGSKCLAVCSYLQNCTELATFPASTSVIISNRAYIKTEDAMYGKWSIVLPETATAQESSPNSLQKKQRFIFIPNKQEKTAIFSKKRFARSSRCRWDD